MASQAVFQADFQAKIFASRSGPWSGKKAFQVITVIVRCGKKELCGTLSANLFYLRPQAAQVYRFIALLFSSCVVELRVSFFEAGTKRGTFGVVTFALSD